MVAAKLAGLWQRLQQRLQLLLRPRVPNTQIGEATGRKVLVVDPEPTPKTGWRLVMEVNSPPRLRLWVAGAWGGQAASQKTGRMDLGRGTGLRIEQ